MKEEKGGDKEMVIKAICTNCGKLYDPSVIEIDLMTLNHSVLLCSDECLIEYQERSKRRHAMQNAAFDKRWEIHELRGVKHFRPSRK